jgi:hypothetical protein
MATITSNASCNPSSLSVSKNSKPRGTISWSKPAVPEGATISSCVLTGTPSISNNKISATVNGTSVKSGTQFSINLGNTNATTSVNVTTSVSGNASGTVSFSNLVYTVTYEEAEKPTVFHTVVFKDFDGAVIGTPQTVGDGESAIAPEDPVREGYRFIGWDKDFSNVTGYLVVTAQYEKNSSGGDEPPSVGGENLFPSFIDADWECDSESDFMMIPIDDFNAVFEITTTGYYYQADISQFKGKTIKLLVDDINLVSMGIYKDASALRGSLIYEGNFETYYTIPNDNSNYYIIIKPSAMSYSEYSITNAQLYIVGEETQIEAYTVEFGPYNYTDGDTDRALKVEGVLKGNDATPPTNIPNRDGYTFIGWDGEYTNVTSDRVLKAQYVLNEPEEPDISEDGINTFYLGNELIKGLRIGDKEILKIYLGDKLIFNK